MIETKQKVLRLAALYKEERKREVLVRTSRERYLRKSEEYDEIRLQIDELELQLEGQNA